MEKTYARTAMLILEKPFCEEEFVFIKKINDIKNTKNNTTLIFNYSHSLEPFIFCKNNDIPYGVIISNIKELIFVSNLNAKYVFTDILQNAVKFQKIVDDYLLDTKNIYLADSLNEIETVAKYTIDGIKIKEKTWQK